MPAKWLGPIGPITPTRSSRLGVHFFTRGGVPTDFGPLTDGGGPGSQWYYYYDGRWWPVQAPNTPCDAPQPPVTTGIHGYYWYLGHYGPTGVWYPGVWLAY